MHAMINIRHKSNKVYIIFLMHNFAINIIYQYDRRSFIKKTTVINKIVPDFMDTLYIILVNVIRRTRGQNAGLSR